MNATFAAHWIDWCDQAVCKGAEYWMCTCGVMFKNKPTTYILNLQGKKKHNWHLQFLETCSEQDSDISV